ncbi:hypothetical protein FB567DRAFT_481992, partial [Paraphoma chrysanthemicola]
MSNPDDYTIGWICALHEELVAATAFLDEEHDPPDRVSRHDANDYTLGKMGRHNVVIAVLPSSEYGTASSASVARDMVHSFPNIRLGLMVGIGGGAPSKKHDIRLGDVVVSNPDRGSGSVFQYDFGKMIQGHGLRTTAILDQPPRTLRTAVNGLRARYARTGHDFERAINDAFERSPRLRSKYSRPEICTDRLYQPGVVHIDKNGGSCAEICGDDPAILVSRSQRTENDDNPAIHYGVIASANQVMKDAQIRDFIATANDVLCFEMEAAGLMNNFPCLVIRGICDYADSHKNKEWQGCAAMTAAAYAKDLVCRIIPNSVEAERKLSEILSATEELQNDSKKRLKLQQEAMKQGLSDKENQCLRLFRRTSSEKDITYEWSKNRVAERVEGTCNWVIEHDNFKEWLRQESGPLLVSADPGCGKSVLAKYLVDSYLARHFSQGSVTLCYFFFRDPDQNTVRQALCALLHQLFCQKSSLIHHAMSEYERNGENLVDSSQSLWTILKCAVEDPATGPVILLLDALDECAEFDDLMRNLKSFFPGNQSGCCRLRFLLTSRPYEQIVSSTRGLSGVFSRIHVPGEESSEIISLEINLVTEYKIHQLTEEKQLSEQVKLHLASCLRKITHRTYLWLYLVFDFLHSEDFKQTLKGVESAISTLPRSVHEAYERILSKSKEGKIVRKALSIILAAERPLTLGEMNVALNIERTSQSMEDLDLESEPRFRSRLRSMCGLFVSIYRGSVYFLHQTAREFLLADAASISCIPSKLKWHQCMTMQDAHRVLAPLCVQYLGFFGSDNILLTDTTFENRFPINDRPFLHYSARFWGLHFREAHIGIHEDDAVVRLVLEISTPTNKAFSVWHAISPIPWGYDQATSLIVASYMGHTKVVPLLLEIKADVNEIRGKHGSALHAAAYNGHNQVVKMLLDNGAKINVQDERHRTPLVVASTQGHEVTVQLLRDRGANINAQDEQHRTALMEASFYGHEAIVQLLVDRGANVNAWDTSQRTPLFEASTGGHEAVVKLLLEKGACINARGKCFRTALIEASSRGFEAVVKLLLEKGADVNTRDIFKCTALLVASTKGYEAIVKLLLSKGADTDVHSGMRGNALHTAAYNGEISMLELLVSKATSMPPQDQYGRTLLWWAAAGGETAAVEALIKQHDFDPTTPNKFGQTPLWIASKKGHIGTADYLV